MNFSFPSGRNDFWANNFILLLNYATIEVLEAHEIIIHATREINAKLMHKCMRWIQIMHSGGNVLLLIKLEEEQILTSLICQERRRKLRAQIEDKV